MYEGVLTSVHIDGGKTYDFPIIIGLRQDLTLIPYLFTLILDVLTKHIQELAPICMLFAYDIVFLEEFKEDFHERLKTWRLS